MKVMRGFYAVFAFSKVILSLEERVGGGKTLQYWAENESCLGLNLSAVSF
jgi:hypothetical protein